MATTEDNNSAVEVDPAVENVGDDDSAYGDDIASYTTSLASSVFEYRMEHGRRYHAFREGSYNFPNDDKEQDRLDMLDHIVTLASGNKLHQTVFPKGKEPKRILDVGCGTGKWAILMGDKFPDADVIGNDLSPIQPKWVPSNVSFEIDDVEDEWPPRAKFDFIHVRYLAASIKDWPKLVERVFENTEPGGFVEFQDWSPLYSQGGQISEDNPIMRLYALLEEVCDNKLGRPLWPGLRLKEWIEAAGFVNVQHQVFKIPLSPWAKDPTLKEVGALNLVQFLEGCEAYILAPFTRFLGWKPEECQVFLADVRKEAKKKNLHLLSNYHVVTAQRPAA